MRGPGRKVKKAFALEITAPDHQGYDDGPWALFRLVDYARQRSRSRGPRAISSRF
jgi:hypothetical protein